MQQRHPFVKFLTTIILLVLVLGGLLNSYSPAQAAITLTITPITWNVIGLDSNNPATGPRFFPVAARVCSIGGPSDGPVAVNFVWGNADATYITLRTPITSINVGALATGACADAYFEVAVNPVMAAFDQTRPYTITATDADETVSTPQPRELYVEHLISQNRNATTGMRYGTTLANLTSVAAGGSMNLVVGGTYYIELTGGTATQGYEQFEEFITLTNTIFRINSVVTDYAADSSPYVTDPSDMLYADACLWENDVNSPNYRACLSAGKAGGAPVTVTYNVTIIGGGGTTQTLNSLLYDFSGSSYHYNSDFSAGARFANIINPSTATIEKEFVPATISNGGVSTLVFTLRNPNAGALSDYNFSDVLPAGMTIVNPPAPITSSCGSSATVTAPNGGNTVNFSGGTLAANGTCTISVTVTAPVVTSPSTTYNNTSNNLFIGTVNTGDNAANSLTVTDAPPPPACITVPMATWTFATAGSATAPAPATINVPIATAAAGPGLSLPAPTTPVIGPDRVGTAGSGSWQVDNITDDTPPGLVLANDEYFEFVLTTTGFNSVTLQFYTDRSAQGPANVQLYYGPVTGTETTSTVFPVPGAWTLQGPITLNTGLNPNGTTRFRLYAYDSGNNNNGHYIRLDDVTFTGCGVPRGPTITKNFAPDPIAAGGTSTLTFTLTNPNMTVALNNVSFTDNLPAGMDVADTPAAVTNCGGTWNPLANAATLTFTGGVIPINSSCTLRVDVTTSVLGPSTNISGFISSTETGINNQTGGSATDTLTVIAPPQIDKVFSPNPIVAGGTSRLTFTITNPNQNNPISGVAFSDILPAGVPGPGSMTVAAVPSQTNTCGGMWTTNPGAGSVTLTGVNIGAGGSCEVSVLVTVPSAGTYANTSGNVSHIVNGVPVNGNTTADTLVANAPNPGIRIFKQIGTGGNILDPWYSYLAVAPATPIYYLVTIENIGDVPLDIISVTDPNLAALIGACTWTNPLPVADAFDDDHIDYCILGSVPAAAGVHTNTATVNAQYGGNPLPPQSDSATYATTGLTVDKVANPTTYTAAGNVINYTITVTNTGSAILNGPVTVTDSLIPTLTCPALNTIGNNNNFFDPITSVPTEILTCTGTYTITLADVTAGSVTNTATADTNQTAPVTDNVTVTLQNPALTLAKTGAFVDGNGDTLPQAGETINYTFLVTNTGNVALTNVAVTDPLIPTITCPSGNPIPTLAVGGTETCTATYVITAADITAGQVLNTATADSDQTTPVTDNETVILAAPALTLVKTGAFVDGNGDNTAQVGETINYTFLVTNTGNVALTNVAVTDPLLITITCPSGNPIPNLAVGAAETCTGTYTLVAADITAGQVLNTAAADSDQTTPVTDNETVNLAVPALTLAKTGAFVDGNGDNAAQVGETINYTFVVTNTGNVALTNVAVTDPLITTITCPSGNPIPNLAIGASETCTGTYTLLAGDITAGQVLNTATADSDQTAPITDNETVNLAVPALTLVKTGVFVDGNGDNAAQVGETINYTFLVTNTGNVALTNVAVTDPLLITITCPSGTPIPSLAIGVSETCTGTYTLVAADITAGQVLNTATADSDQTTPITDNETVNLAVPALTLAKTGVFVDGNGDNAAQVGETINYTFLVTNTGNVALTNVAVTDPLIPTITCPSGNPIPTLAVGGTETCTGTYTLLAADITAGQVLNTATADSDQTTPITDNETVNLAVPALTLVKTGAFVDGNGDNTAQVGETINYTFLVTNTGNVALTNVAVTDPLLITITCPSGNPIPNLAVGAAETCTGTYTLVAGDITAGQVLNTATADSDQTTPITDNETVNLAVPALTLVKTGAFVDGNGDNAAQVGETINYTFLVTNTGNVALTNVAVTDPLITTITCPSGNPIPNLAIGTSETCTGTYTLVAADITAGQVLNTATADSDQTTPVTDNETVNLAVPALTLAKTGAFVDGNGDNAAQVGETINYTFVVTNTGNVALTNVAVTDPLITTITCPSGNPIPNLAIGASETCTGTYTLVAGDITAGQVLNTATADSDQTTPITDNETVPLAVPAVTLAKTGVFVDGNGDNAAQVGETINYTFLVTNTGNVALTNVAVTDPLLITITCPSGNPIPNLAIGVSETCTGTYTLVAADITAGQVLNTATADSDQTAPITDNETVNLAVAGLTLVKTGAFIDGNGDNAAQVGETINYTFLVTNTGNVALTNVVVTDPLIPTITCPSGNPIPTLAIGAAETCMGTYTLVVGDITAGQVLNTATADSDQTTPVTDNETVNLAVAGLTLVKTGAFVDGNGDNAAQVGETIAYTFMVTNTGNGSLTNVTVTDPLIPTITCPSGNPIPNLAAGASTFCTGSHTLGLADISAGQVVNTASADSDQTLPVSDTVTVAIPMGQPPNILYFDPSISKVGQLGQGQLGLVGEHLVWLVTITNIGNAPGTNVVVCDALVPELQVNSATIDIGTATVNGQEVCFYIDTLAPGQVINGQINSTVLDSPASGVIENTVTLTGTGPDGVVQVANATAVIPVPTGLPATGYPPVSDKEGTKLPFIWIIVSAVLMTLLAGGWYWRKQQ